MFPVRAPTSNSYVMKPLDGHHNTYLHCFVVVFIFFGFAIINIIIIIVIIIIVIIIIISIIIHNSPSLHIHFNPLDTIRSQE